jgi:hypothetical protein
MIKTFASMSVILAFALTPAHAGKDKDRERDKGPSAEKVLDRLEGLQERLQQEDISDRQREKVEGQLERIIEKYGIELPPPPPDPEPEPTKLFSDDFNRDQTAPGNGWAGNDASIDGGRLKLSGGNNTANEAEAYKTLGLAGETYQSFTVTYDIEPNEGSQAHQNLQLFWTEGDAADKGSRTVAITESLYQTGAHTSTWTTPEAPEGDPYDAFSFGFKTNGSAWIDNVTVTGNPVPASEPFVGF